MHVCIDFRPALRHATGVGTYVRNLVGALRRADEDLVITAFSASVRHRLPRIDGVLRRDWRIPVRLLDWSWHRWRWPPVEWLVGPQDVAHSGSPLLMPASRARQVITVHDCWFLRHPEDVFGPVRRDYVPLARASAARADAVVVPTRTTGQEVHDLLDVPDERIRVTPLGVDPVFLEAGPDGPAAGLLERAGVEDGYLLFVGRREPRKDLGTLLSALAHLAPRLPGVHLLLVGPDAPGWAETWGGAAEAARERATILPHQPPESLAGLYRRAGALVVCSRWEGFGLTALEAAAVGTPVVATRAGSLPEVLGDAARWVEPGDAEGLAAACHEVLTDDALATALRTRGRRRAREFRWERTAELTRELYEELAGA